MGCQFSLFSWLTSKSRNFPPMNFISSMRCTTSNRLGANIYCRLNTMALFICMCLCVPLTMPSNNRVLYQTVPRVEAMDYKTSKYRLTTYRRKRKSDSCTFSTGLPFVSHTTRYRGGPSFCLAKSAETSLEPHALQFRLVSACPCVWSHCQLTVLCQKALGSG